MAKGEVDVVFEVGVADELGEAAVGFGAIGTEGAC